MLSCAISTLSTGSNGFSLGFGLFEGCFAVRSVCSGSASLSLPGLFARKEGRTHTISQMLSHTVKPTPGAGHDGLR